jgi:hypothetical protein
MRAKQFVLSTAATGATPWIPLDYKQSPFSVGFSIDIAGNTGTYVIEHGFSDMYKRYPAISRTTTTATVTLANHGLQVADSVVVAACGAPLDGTYAVATVTDVNTFTYTVANSGVAANNDGGWLIPIRVFPHSVLGSAQTTSKDGNYAFPAQYMRMRCTVSGAGSYYLNVAQGVS